MGLGLASMNNTWLVQMPHQLGGYYWLMVHIAQGLVHMCKGTIGLNSFFPDLNIMSWLTVVGLLGTSTACKLRWSFGLSQVLIVVIVVVLDRHHWMLYFLVTDMYPRFLITLNDELYSMCISIGQMHAIHNSNYSVSDWSHPTDCDAISKVGKLQTIWGFRKHQMHIRLSTGPGPLTKNKAVTDLFILSHPSLLLKTLKIGVEVTVEDYGGMVCALISLLMLTCWLLMCLTNESAFNVHRYNARNTTSMVVYISIWCES